MEMPGMSEALISLAQISVINIVLSGDNAVVIALACRRLSPKHQKIAFIWGSVGVVVLMVLLTAIVVWLLSLPYLEIVGSAMLTWIGIKLLAAEEEGGGEDGVEQKSTLAAAIRTIIIADIIMSLDNVLAMAGAAKGHMWMLFVGLAITVPVILFGSALLMKLMERFPVLVTAGAGVLGYVAGDMAVGDIAIKDQIEAHWHYLDTLAPIVGAAFVIVAGKLLARRKQAAAPAADDKSADGLSAEMTP